MMVFIRTLHVILYNILNIKRTLLYYDLDSLLYSFIMYKLYVQHWTSLIIIVAGEWKQLGIFTKISQ